MHHTHAELQANLRLRRFVQRELYIGRSGRRHAKIILSSGRIVGKAHAAILKLARGQQQQLGVLAVQYAGQMPFLQQRRTAHARLQLCLNRHVPAQYREFTPADAVSYANLQIPF